MRTPASVTVQTDGRGRITLPPELRRHLGVEAKGSVLVEAREDGEIVIRDPRRDRRRRLQAARGAFRGQGQSVDELIAERRSDALREDA
ncbi:MAG: AbrB/MazE/SpoVT family DNA-binding domain-containing protein [Solirubrobacteraceae bacterium]|nr:AbrB/MazE/SpoVT family DNA-binding domain-containing protein [Solirubrobacteraceae bacterium]